MRFSADAFEVFQRRFGRFDTLLGAERAHTPVGRQSESGQRAWLHPTYGTVASALSMLAQRMQLLPGADGAVSEGLVVVPWQPTARWWPMVRHFTVVGRYGVGSRHLDEYWLGSWRSTSARRATLVLAFPRSSGAVALPLSILTAPRPAPSTGVSEARERSARLLREMSVSADQPLPVGSLLYSAVAPGASLEETSAVGGDAGCLYRTVEVYRGVGSPACAWLRRSTPRRGASLGVFTLESGKSTPSGGSYSSARGDAWRPQPHSLWLVNHHDVTARQLSRGPDGWGRRIQFDHCAAEREIEFMRARLSRATLGVLSGRPGMSEPDGSWPGESDELDLADVSVPLDAEPSSEAESDAGSVSSFARRVAAATGRRSRVGTPAAVGRPIRLRRSAPQYEAGPSTPPAVLAARVRSEARRMESEARQAASPEGSGAYAYRDDDDVEPVSGLLARREAAPPLVTPPRAVGEGDSSPEPASLASSPGRSPDYVPFSPRRQAGHVRRTQLSVTGRELTRNSCLTMECAGCGHRLGQIPVCPGGRGMIHDSLDCDRLARASLERLIEVEAASPHAEPDRFELGDGADLECVVIEEPLTAWAAALDAEVAVPTRTGSDQRRAQLAEQTGPARVAMVRCCLEGRCGVTSETPMTCIGPGAGAAPCGATLHGVTCAQLARGVTTLGRFRCASCRLRRVAPNASLPFPDEALHTAMCTMLLELRGGAEATGAGYAEYARLEMLFVTSLGNLGDGVMLPRDDAESFKMFLEWLVVSKERALSLVSLYRCAGAVMSRTRDRDLTKLPDVSAFFRMLKELHGEESQPRTAVTRRMVRLLFEQILPSMRPAHCVVRDYVMLAVEIMLGLRIGESTSGGDFHGVLANNLSILTNNETGVVVCELILEHSKTKFKRVISCMGTSEGEAGVTLAAYLRAYWVEAGFAISTRQEGGYTVESPNYEVLRVSLLGMTSEEFERMGRVLSESRSAEVRRLAPYSVQRGGGRLRATGSMEKRYINVIGGAPGCDDMATASFELQRAGFGEFMRVVPGPLIRATQGPKILAHMPLQPASTYSALHALLDATFAAANADGPDPELDLQGRAEPLWGHHSFRRFADTVARTTRGLTGATEQDIDIIFGWNESMYSHKMQLHYQTKFDREQRCCVTRMV